MFTRIEVQSNTKTGYGFMQILDFNLLKKTA